MQKSSVTQILHKWPSRRAIFEDARKGNPALDMVAVHRWFKRESVPVAHWDALAEGATQRNISVSVHDFMVAHGHRQAGAA